MFKELEKYENHQKHGVEVAEVKIQIPTGIIAGKWWGSKSIKPILCLHGYLDNAGTFDRLIPLLPRNNSYLAIDFPGHGLSDRSPNGALYHTIDNLNIVSLIMDFYKWESISIIGHSMSHTAVLLYAAIFPKKVDKVIIIEGITPRIVKVSVVDSLRFSLQTSFIANQRNQEKNEPPSFTKEDLIEKLHHGTLKSVTKECAPFLLKRSILPSKKHPGKFYFSIDRRINGSINFETSDEEYYEMLQGLQMPFLVLKAKSSYTAVIEENFEKFLENQKGKSSFEFHEIESSSHHMHLTEPEKIAGIIGNFIEKHRNIQSHL